MSVIELMIGDWVQINEYDEYTPAPYNKPYPIQISHGTDIDRADEVTFGPIPITAEILEKNISFERYWDATRSNPKGSVTEWRMDTDTSTIFVRDFRDKKGEYTLEIHIRGYANYGVRKNIYHVHELQHALRLCGLNKLADNFKV